MVSLYICLLDVMIVFDHHISIASRFFLGKGRSPLVLTMPSPLPPSLTARVYPEKLISLEVGRQSSLYLLGFRSPFPWGELCWLNFGRALASMKSCQTEKPSKAVKCLERFSMVNFLGLRFATFGTLYPDWKGSL